MVIFYSCEKKINKYGFTKDNIESKIDSLFIEVETNDNIKPIASLILYVENNNIVFNDACFSAKFYYLRALESYVTNYMHDVMYTNLMKAISLLENCDDVEFKGIVYNLLGIYYDFQDKTQLGILNFKKSLTLLESLENNEFVIDVYLNLIDSNLNKNWFLVEETAKKGITALDAIHVKKPRLKYFYLYLAQAQINLNKTVLAKSNLAKSLEVNKKFKTNNNLADQDKFLSIIFVTYASLYEKEHNYKLAYNYTKSSDSIHLEHIIKVNRKTTELLLNKSDLTNQLNASNQKIIANQNTILIGIILIMFLGFLFLFRTYTLKNKLKLALDEKKVLNNELKSSLFEIEETNTKLYSKKEEVEGLLKYNEQVLFSKTFKLSVYKDAVNNIIKSIYKLVENNSTISSSNLHSINRALEEIISEEDIWNDFKLQFEKNKPDFFKKLLKRFPDLTVTEQKHCAYIAVNLKSKEVASIINLSPRSVETTRYRIKKKMKLKEQSLADFLKKI